MEQSIVGVVVFVFDGTARKKTGPKYGTKVNAFILHGIGIYSSKCMSRFLNISRYQGNIVHLDLHCLQRQDISGFSRTRVNVVHLVLCFKNIQRLKTAMLHSKREYLGEYLTTGLFDIYYLLK